MKITSESSMTVSSPGVTAGELSKWLGSLPENAQVTARTVPGDRPGETSITTYKARWSVTK